MRTLSAVDTVQPLVIRNNKNAIEGDSLRAKYRYFARKNRYFEISPDGVVEGGILEVAG